MRFKMRMNLRGGMLVGMNRGNRRGRAWRSVLMALCGLALQSGVTALTSIVITTGGHGHGSALAQDKKADSLRGTASVEVKNARVMLIERVTLASPRAGVLAFVEAREGDTVESKQVIASLEAEVARASLMIARHKAASTVDRRFAKKVIDLSQAEYKKAQQANTNLTGGGVFTDIDLQRLQLTVDKSTLQLEQAESEARVNLLTVDQLTAELNTYAVVTTFGGTVTKVHRSKGEAVALGDPIVDVVNLGRVRVEGFVGVQDGLRVKAGSVVVVRLDLPNVEREEEQREFKGKLVFVDVGVEPVSGQMRVWAEVPNPDGLLRAGLPARMTILDRAAR